MTTTPTANGRVDTSDMVLVHRWFRRELGAGPDLVRSSAGSRKRAEVVADYLTFMLTGLHTHHAGEDELLWPLLLERTAPDAELIGRMETQHHQVAAAIHETETLLAEWRKEADPSLGQDLADALQRLVVGFDTHLADEEAQILPIVPEHITRAEWKALADHGLGSIPPNKRLVVLSGILDGATAEEAAQFLTNVPAPARVAWRLLGRRMYAKDRQRIYGAG